MLSGRRARSGEEERCAEAHAATHAWHCTFRVPAAAARVAGARPRRSCAAFQPVRKSTAPFLCTRATGERTLVHAAGAAAAPAAGATKKKAGKKVQSTYLAICPSVVWRGRAGEKRGAQPSRHTARAPCALPAGRGTARATGRRRAWAMAEQSETLKALQAHRAGDAEATRGACRKCGQVGHLSFQCRNFIKLEANDGAAPAPAPAPVDSLSSLSDGKDGDTDSDAGGGARGERGRDRAERSPRREDSEERRRRRRARKERRREREHREERRRQRRKDEKRRRERDRRERRDRSRSPRADRGRRRSRSRERDAR